VQIQLTTHRHAQLLPRRRFSFKKEKSANEIVLHFPIDLIKQNKEVNEAIKKRRSN